MYNGTDLESLIEVPPPWLGWKGPGQPNAEYSQMSVVVLWLGGLDSASTSLRLVATLESLPVTLMEFPDAPQLYSPLSHPPSVVAEVM
jgi:hypothetical protein